MNSTLSTAAAIRKPLWVKLLLGLAAVLVLLLLLVVFFPWDWLRGPVNRYVSEQTGRKFEITRRLDVKLGRNTRVIADGIEFANPAWARDPYLIKAEAAEFDIKLWPLLRGQVELPLVSLRQPVFGLQMQADGRRTWALGQDLSFGVGEGPRLEPPLVDSLFSALEAVPERLEPVYATVAGVAGLLPPQTTFLGFAGSPWTVATYMVAGKGSKDQGETRRFAYRDPQAFGAIVDAIADMTVDYLARQIENGVEAVQLFDSWAGSLAPDQYERWVIAPNARITCAVHDARPGIPVIGFPKGSGEKLPTYARETSVDAVGVDETIDPIWAARELPADMPVQGNLDPLLLLAGGPALDERTRAILAAFADRPHVFNLGHGIGQFTLDCATR